MSTPIPPSSGNKFSISVLSTHSNDSSPSLLVSFPDSRFLFGTPEGVSRIALQSKVGLRKVGNVFLGSIQESAGLPGFILSSVEAGNSKIEIVGPTGTSHYLASCRFFTRRDKLSLKITSPTPHLPSSTSHISLPPPIHSDTNLNVYAFPVSPFGASLTSPSSLSHPASSSKTLKRRRSDSRSPSPRSKSPPGIDRSSRTASPSASESDPGSPNFRPSRLSGAEAAMWRKMVLRDMFRGSAFDGPETTVASEVGSKKPPKERRGPSPAYLPESLPTFDGTPDVVSYLVVGPVQVGKFLPAEAAKRGVEPGKAFARLKKGERVWVRKGPADGTQAGAIASSHSSKTESKKDRARRLKEEKAKQEELESKFVDGEGEGIWVTPAECMGPGQDACAFVVLNIPSPDYLHSLPLAVHPELLSRATLGPSTSLRCIFYLLGPGVLGDPRFQTYLSSLQSALPKDVHHRVSSADHVTIGKDEVTFGPSALLNLRLSKLDNDMFNVPKYSFIRDFTPPSAAALSTLSTNQHFLSSTSLQLASVSPLGGEIRSFNFDLDTEEAEMEASRLKGAEKPMDLQERGLTAWNEYLAQVEEVKLSTREEIRERASSSTETSESIQAVEGNLRITPLGTGSAIPSKYRNVSSTLLHIPVPPTENGQEDYVLLDAGEGTWGQLVRRFGLEEALKVLGRTKLIFISHLHQDHHAGLSTLLRERARLTPRPLFPLTIVAPSNARMYLWEQQQLFDLGLDSRQDGVRFIDNFTLEPGKSLQEGSRAYDALLGSLGLASVVAVPVLHRCRAWGVVITHSDGWRVVFSGDTMPCDALVEHGRGASLLIHEATIEDELPEVALAKGHSTSAQAIDIATRMQARHLLLTHFSARYPKLPPASAPLAVSELRRPVVATAFDLMTLKLSEFWKMEKYRDALDTLLGWDEVETTEGGVNSAVTVE
ncbi:hypothetical protein JCM11491_006513 [Sporobolomyces phaffii]